MSLALAYFRTRMLELVRTPAYVLPTVILPAMFFALFAGSLGDDPARANGAMTAYVVFAIMGVMFFQFGVGSASSRESEWERYLRTLPTTAWPRFAAQIASALLFATVSAAVVVTTAVLLTDASLTWAHGPVWVAALLLGAIPFGFMGFALGYWVPARAAAPVANLIYLPMAFFGGLWIPVEFLPTFAARLSAVLPSRHLAEVGRSAMSGGFGSQLNWMVLFGYAVAFAFIAARGYQRNEEQKYS
ncbi:MAG TPA: ABC transporter permease [Longimicrobium sp.]|nr:ABC transporter permease [Longimicrobium sp.]